MREVWRRLRWLLHRGQFERELEEEMRHHLEMKGGETTQFGNVTLLKEDSRAMWTGTFREQFGQDVRYGLRAMAGNKLFTTMAVLSLALGIGANTAIYSFMDAIMLRALPVQHPEQLVLLNWHAKAQPAVIHSFDGGGHQDAKTGFTSSYLPYPAVEFLDSKSSVLSDLFGFTYAGRNAVIFRNAAALADGQYVTGRYFTGLGMLPAAGRLIDSEDDRVGATPVAVLAWDYWRQRFAGDAAVVGQTILIDTLPYTIAGVAQPGFRGLSPERIADFFMPLHSIPKATMRLTDPHYYWIAAMGRLRNGVSLTQAQAALSTSFHQFVVSTAQTEKERADLPEILLQEGGSGIDSLRRRYSRPLTLLIAMTGLILLIACANIASLLLARATARRREIAVRLSLGAGRWRIIRQLLTESLLLSFLGGVLVVAVALPGMRLIFWLLASGNTDFSIQPALDWHILGFTLALAFATGILFGVVPAVQTTSVEVTPALKESRAGALHGRGKRFTPGRALVVAQIALSLILVIAAGLFVRTLANLESTELGFNRDHTLLVTMAAKGSGYKDAALIRFYDDLLDRFRSIPGVSDASLSDFPLVGGSVSAAGVRIPGLPVAGGEAARAALMPVGASFFTTMKIPVLMGREFDRRDSADSVPVGVVNEMFAKKYFAGINPLGPHFGVGTRGGKSDDIEIVGVVKNARHDSLRHDTPPIAFIPYSQNHLFIVNLVTFELRTVGNPLIFANSVRRIVQEKDPRVPIYNITTQSAQIDRTIGKERTFADLCACFALLALAISCVGLYGTMAYAVARRTGEIGIRVALGAQRRRVMWMVLREVFALSSIGLAIGLAAALSMTRFVESFLFGMKPNDPLAISLSVAVLACAALAAGYAPAWRASRIDPMVALRHE